MDAVRVTMLRELLAGTEWLESTRAFAGALRGSVARSGHAADGLLLVGTEAYEPWHLAAHLDDEAAWSGLPELSPTLVRCAVPEQAPAHLSVGLDRLEDAGRGETVLVVAPEDPGEAVLERLCDARRGGATVLALEGGAGTELGSLAHESLAVPEALCHGAPGAAGLPSLPPAVRPGAATFRPAAHQGPERPWTGQHGFDTMQHLVSATAGEQDLPPATRGSRLRTRLTRLADALTVPPARVW